MITFLSLIIACQTLKVICLCSQVGNDLAKSPFLGSSSSNSSRTTKSSRRDQKPPKLPSDPPGSVRLQQNNYQLPQDIIGPTWETQMGGGANTLLETRVQREYGKDWLVEFLFHQLTWYIFPVGPEVETSVSKNFLVVVFSVTSWRIAQEREWKTWVPFLLEIFENGESILTGRQDLTK